MRLTVLTGFVCLTVLSFSRGSSLTLQTSSSHLARAPQSESSSVAVTCATLEDKLLRQMSLFESARSVLLTRVVEDHQPLARAEWEALLQPRETCEWQKTDLDALRARQDQDIEKSKTEARAKSVLNLDLLRNDVNAVSRFCAELPKGAILHEHANGTMNRATARSILERIDPLLNLSYMLEKAHDPNVELYPDELAWIEKLAQASPRKKFSELSADDQTKLIDLFFLPKDPYDHSFKRFSYPFLIFPLLRDKTQPLLDPDTLQLIDFLRRAHGMGIRYVELTKGVRLDPESMTKLHETAELLRKETGVIVHWNYAFFRNAEVSKNSDLAYQLLSTLEQHPSDEIVGIDLLANEETAPALESGQLSYAPVLAAVTGKLPQFRSKLRRTFHAGELGLTENVRDALIMGAERVGHGVRMEQDPVTLELARRQKLGVEVSPVSNLRLRVVKNLKEHPFLRFLRLGLKVSLSTDDEGVLETDMNNECVQVVSQTDVQYEEMKSMIYNSIETSFATEEEKKGLLQWLDQSYLEFEKKWRAAGKK